MLDHALALAARGFHVFPLLPKGTPYTDKDGHEKISNGKIPAVANFPERATRDEDRIRKWWSSRDYNVAISTSKFDAGKALLAVDVDMKNGKNGCATIAEYELRGEEFPVTFEQQTPTGGQHLIYVVDEPMKQSVEALGPGIDIRSRGGFIVGCGSEIDGREYSIRRDAAVAPAPGWLVERVGRAPDRPAATGEVLEGVDRDRAIARAIEYLKTAPTQGDPEAYPVACKLKDFGVSEQDAVQLLQEHWDPRCDPPRSDDTATTVRNAYRYGKEPQGSAAPEAVFPKVEAPTEPASDARHPAERLNDQFAFIKEGAFVLQETTDAFGHFTTIRLTPADMHAWFANKCMQIGEKKVPLSRVWMAREGRREYDGVVFSPLQDAGPRFYNHWRGFAVAPRPGDHPAVAAFMDHALRNVCGGDATLCHWLLGYFAHMVQRPWEKPLVALVFRGAKGTGKNALVERVGALLGPHFMVADDERYLLSNFNAHLEANLFFVLDEASWAGDKRAEGRLKGLITGTKHNIEHKNGPVCAVRNLTRVAILGNERWLVPATFDERRFAVFTVGDGRRQDRKFFQAMREGMEAGGYAHLLHFLQHFDLAGVDVNAAPVTSGLIDQKHASLDPVQEWWLDCLEANQLLGSAFTGAIPERVPTERVREAFVHWARGRNIKSRLPDQRAFVSALRQAAPSMEKKKGRIGEDFNGQAFFNPGIEALREDWDKFIGGTHRWEE